MLHIPRILLAAPASGAGKTMITCGILQILKKKKRKISAYKCGPDYIDPMFHREVLGVNSYNLDTFLCGKEGVRSLLAKHGADTDIAVLEGVMGYYDGLAGTSTEASAYDIADTTRTPAVLIVDCKGSSVSVIPVIQGFLNYREDSHISGVILNRISPMLYERMKDRIEKETNVTVYGYVPVLKDFVLESRYLGLKMPHEKERIRDMLRELGAHLEQTVDVEGLQKLAFAAPDVKEGTDREGSGRRCRTGNRNLRIGLARDEAFCFMYQDNLELLESKGAGIVPFSPLHDSHLPANLDGVLFYGGYPELYARELSENKRMIWEVKEALQAGLPCMAECGGFMYLMEEIKDAKGHSFKMAGALKGSSYQTPSLRRFGYLTLTGGKAFGKDVGEIPAHEFHYYDSDACGSAFVARKPVSEKTWACMVSTDTILAGYPHIHYYGNPKVAEAFLQTCETGGRR